MVNVIYGLKGSGKTYRLVDELNEQAQNKDMNVVCIAKGDRLNRFVKHRIRMVDISEYNVKGYKELRGFILGIMAKDYDLSHLYIDSILKVSGVDDVEQLEAFLNELDEVSTKRNVKVTIIYSVDPTIVSEGIKKFS